MPELEVPKFGLFDLRGTMRYHLAFHRTWQLRLNHFVFMHGYLFSLFVLAVVVGGPRMLTIVTGFIGIYYMLLSHSTVGILYLPLVVVPLAVRAFWFVRGVLQGTSYLQQQLPEGLLGGKVSLGIWSLTGMAISVFAQVTAHQLYEDFPAPLHLVHRLLAAPLCEWLAFWLHYETWRSSKASFFMRKYLWWWGWDLRDLIEEAESARAEAYKKRRAKRQ